MIGIIAAESKEMNEIKKIMSNIVEEQIFNLTFYKGSIESKDCILVKCGEGKVNAARTAQILIDNFKIEKLINVGSAGAINEELNVKDVVIAEKLVQYDFDISGLGYEKGEICNIGKYIYCDKNLVKKCEVAIENLEKSKSLNKSIINNKIVEKMDNNSINTDGINQGKSQITNKKLQEKTEKEQINSNEMQQEKIESKSANLNGKNYNEGNKKIEKTETKQSEDELNFKAIIGTIATADSFCDKPEIAKKVREEFGAECVEMEGAAIAQVCYLDKIPFLVIRGISDTPNGNNKMDFKKYLEIASKQSAKILQNLLKTI